MAIRIGLRSPSSRRHPQRGWHPRREPVLPTEPQVANSGHRILGEWWRRIGSLLVGNCQQSVDLARIEASEGRDRSPRRSIPATPVRATADR